MADISRLIDELIAVVGEDSVQTGAAMDAYRVEEKVPWAAVSPADVDQVAAVLALAHRESLAVVPWGGGTSMALGLPPERVDIALRLHRLNRLLEHEPADLSATAQAGIPMGDLQRQLGRRGQWWAIDPQWPEDATLGGVLATNSSGPKRLLYGTARDLVIGIKVVHADGSISKAGGKVTKNVTGYDMMKLYINSLGTLGVIVEATLKLRPLPPVQRMVWASFVSAAAGGCAARQILASELLPNAVELVNPAVSAFLHQTVEGPEGEEKWSLLVGMDGVEPAVARQIHQLEEICRETGATGWWTGNDDGRLWTALQARFRPQGADGMQRVVIRVGTVRTQIMGILEMLERSAASLNAPAELTARMGNGIIYSSILLHADSGGDLRLAKALDDVRARLADARGYLVIESAPPSFKPLCDCWGDMGPQLEVMRGLKLAFDPRRVLNPGRFIGGL